MGNYVCCPYPTPTFTKSKAAKVILPSGEIKEFQNPTKAAEVMLEVPNYFLVNSKSLQIGKSISALNADDELEMGNLYIMFGMKRLNSFVTAHDNLDVFVASKYGGSGHGIVRIVPASSGDGESAAREVDAAEMKVEFQELLFQLEHSRSVARSKKPVLETIMEEPMFAR